MALASTRAAVVCIAATACFVLSACGGSGGGTAATTTGSTATTGGTTGSKGAGASVIPAGASAADQLKALKNCQPTLPGDAVHWLVDSSQALPKYAVPTASPKVGTSLASWPTTPMVVMGDCQNTEAWVFTAADSKNFYIAAQVDSTTTPVDGTAAAPWTGDCLQFAFDPQDEQTSGGYGPNDDEMGMILLDGAPSLFQNIGGAAQTMPPSSVTGSQVSITRKNGITLYEGSIPWTAIGSKVNPTFGFNIVVAAGGPPYAGPNWGYEWTQGIIEGKNPSNFAQLTVKK